MVRPSPSLDCGPNWLADNNNGAPGAAFRNTGSNASTYNQAFTVQYAPNGPVPQSTPSQVFSTERWDPSGGNEMNWNFPVASGTPIQVRLYFANQCDCTASSGQRVFDVVLDGSVVLNDFDIVANVGNRVGTVRTFNRTSDGNVDVDLTHMVENPLINAIEIVRTDIPPVQPPAATFLVQQSFDGTTAGNPSQLQTPNVNWSSSRGAFMIGGTLYTGLQDGTLQARSFNGSTLGPATVLNPYLASPGAVFANVTGAFFAGGSIYYTVAGDATMHSRYFTPDSGIIGAVQFNVPANGFNWSQARSLTMANGKLYWATPDANLHSATFTGTAPQAGTDAVVSGPGIDGRTWGGNYGMFVLSTPNAGDTQDPTAPGNLHATSVTSFEVDLAWNASTDNTGVTAYDIYRGGSLFASVPGNQTTYSDPSVASGTFYTYRVLARDAAGNESPFSNILNVTTPPSSNAFEDGFESGNMSAWTASQGMTVQSADVFAGSNAAMATASGSPAFASRTLTETFPQLNYQAAFKIVSQGANAVNLMRFQTGAGASIATLFVGTNGNLGLRNDVTASTVTSSTPVSPGTWREVEVVLNVNGASGTVQVLLDGVQVNALTSTMNFGNTPIGRLMIGDNTTGKTFQVAFDEVVAFVTSGDTQDPTAPSGLQATAVTNDHVDLSWGASTDNVGVTSYEIRRNGGAVGTVPGNQTTFTDSTVAPGTAYTYQVFANDAATNQSPGSNTVNVTTTSLAFSDGFESGNMSNWTSVVGGVAVQSADVFAGSNAAMVTSTGTRAFAYRTLSSNFTTLRYKAAFKIVSQGANAVNLLRLQTDAGANIVTLYASTGGNLSFRNDTNGTTMSSSTVITPGTWRELEMRVTISGASSTIQVLLNGTQINQLTTTLNLGTTPIRRVMIGDNNAGRTFQVGFDEVVAV